MQTKNAIKKLEGKGLEVRPMGINQFCAYSPTYTIDWSDDMGQAHAFYVKSNTTCDDLQTDYFAGTWCESLKRAMEIAGIS